jgi:hypothetical protein
VLQTYERNGYDDSDFCALVWDDTAARPRTVEYGTTRFWTYHNTASVDATDEISTKALAWYRDHYAATLIVRAYWETTQPTVGKVVKSTTTRGKNVGVQGTVKWVGDNSYRRGVQRVGIKVDGEDNLRYLDADRCEVINPPEIDETALREQAARYVPANWRSAEYAILGA